MARVCTDAQKDVLSHLALDLAVGLGWLLMSPHRTAALGYAPAKAFLNQGAFYSMRAYGAALVVLGLCLALSALLSLSWLYESARIALTALWAFFAGVFVISFMAGDASPLGPAWAILWTIRTARLPVISPWVRMMGNQ